MSVGSQDVAHIGCGPGIRKDAAVGAVIRLRPTLGCNVVRKC